jgi:hypothetical protein
MKIHEYLNSVRVISVVAILTSALAYSVFHQQTVTSNKAGHMMCYIHTVLHCNGPN